MSTFGELARDSLHSAIVHLAPRAANVLLFIVIGRYAGPSDAGVFALATTYLIIATTLTKGMDDLIVRQVSRDVKQAPFYLVNFILVRMGLAAALYAGVYILATHLIDYPINTLRPIQIVTLSLLPDSLALVAQAVLLGMRKFSAPAWLMSAVTVFKVVSGAIALYTGGGITGVCWWWLVGSWLGLAGMMIAVLHNVGPLSRAHWKDWSCLRAHWRELRTFLAITLLTTSESQTDIVLLSIFRDETEVGWYNAATTVAFSLGMISQAYRMAVYPLMTQYAIQAPQKLTRLRQESLRYLGMLAFPMTAGIILIAPSIVTLIYKQAFTPAILALQILVPSLIFLFLNVPSARTMLVYDRQSQSLHFLMLSTFVNILLNLLLDSRWGAAGAATARVFSAGLYFFMTHTFVERSLAQSKMSRLLRPTLLATLAMGCVVWFLRQAMILAPISAGIGVYALTLWLAGGITASDISRVKTLLHSRRTRG